MHALSLKKCLQNMTPIDSRIRQLHSWTITCDAILFILGRLWHQQHISKDFAWRSENPSKNAKMRVIGLQNDVPVFIPWFTALWMGDIFVFKGFPSGTLCGRRAFRVHRRVHLDHVKVRELKLIQVDSALCRYLGQVRSCVHVISQSDWYLNDHS